MNSKTTQKTNSKWHPARGAISYGNFSIPTIPKHIGMHMKWGGFGCLHPQSLPKPSSVGIGLLQPGNPQTTPLDTPWTPKKVAEFEKGPGRFRTARTHPVRSPKNASWTPKYVSRTGFPKNLIFLQTKRSLENKKVLYDFW